MLITSFVLVSCSEDDVLLEDTTNYTNKNDELIYNSKADIPSEDYELGKELVEITTRMTFEEEYINKENLRSFENKIYEATSSGSQEITFEEYSSILQDELTISSDANTEFLYFIQNNSKKISRYKTEQFARILEIVIEEEYESENVTNGAISTVAGWFGIGDEDSSCSEQVLVAFADTAISSVVFAGSTLTGPGAILGAANLATSYGDLLLTATTCEQH
ncbi:MAG: hypothetical protein ACQESK_08055 [Bacteroidota bacterium]